MKISFFSTQPYDKEFFNLYNDSFGYELEYFETHLNLQTVTLVDKSTIVCVFVNDKVDANVIESNKKCCR